MRDFQDFDVDGRRRRPTAFPWGIYVVSAGCGLVTLLASRLVMTGGAAEQAFGALLAVLSLATCVGITLRVNALRLLLLALLYLSYVADILLILHGWQMGHGIRYGRIFIRMALTVATILYLQRSDVRAVFVDERTGSTGEVRKKLARRVGSSLIGTMCGFLSFLVLLIGNNAAPLGIEPSAINALFFALFFVGGLGGFVISVLFGAADPKGE